MPRTPRGGSRPTQLGSGLWISSVWAITAVLLAATACGRVYDVDTSDDDTAGDDDSPSGDDDSPSSSSSGRPARPRDAGADARNDYVEPDCGDVPEPITRYECDPFDPSSCGEGASCEGYVAYPSDRCDPETYITYCSIAGTGTQGDPCGGLDEGCAAGFWCLITGAGTTCARTCDLAAADPCDDGMICVSTDVSGVGACQ